MQPGDECCSLCSSSLCGAENTAKYRQLCTLVHTKANGLLESVAIYYTLAAHQLEHVHIVGTCNVSGW